MFGDKVLEFMQHDWRASIEDIEQRFDTNARYGLEEEEARARIELDGPNYRDEPPSRSEWIKLFTNLVGIHNLPLWFGATLYLLAFFLENSYFFNDLEIKSDKFYIGIGLILFVLSFGLFSYYMAAKCEYYVESCRDLVESYAIVIRDGVHRQVLKEQLVVGDVLVLRHGDQLKTDVKLTESFDVSINVEFLEQKERYYYKQLYGVLERNFEVGDIVLHGSYIATGFAKAIVLATCEYYITKSCIQFSNKPKRIVREELSPLTYELRTFLSYLTIIAIFFGSLWSTAYLISGFPWLEAAMFFIALYVAIITEALLPTLNVCKTQIAKDLANKNCYIQNITVLETLGKTDVICTNKTGVLTQTRMIVSQLWLDHQLINAYDFLRQFRAQPLASLRQPVRAFIECGAGCNFANFSVSNSARVPSFMKSAVGKPSEVALLRFIDALFDGQLSVYQRNSPPLSQLRFTKGNNFTASLHRREDGGEGLVAYIKAMPEMIIERAQYLLKENGPSKLSLYEKARLFEVCLECSLKKERVLAVGMLELSDEDIDINLLDLLARDNLCMIGLVSLQNPVRLSVPEAIFKCQRAGVKVIMTTGDHPGTASSVAKLVGLTRCKNRLTVLTNEQMLAMSDAELQNLLRAKEMNLVVGRIDAGGQLRLANLCLANRSIMAMTGVGSDCLPFFEHAHVRLSLGKYGSDVAKNNSDVILLDDNFSSIVYGIEQGRVLFENVKKSLCYTLSSKPPELLMGAMPFIFHIPRVGSAITVIAIDLLTDNLPPIALAYESIETHVMERDPKKIRITKTIEPKMLVLSILFYGLFQFLSGFLVYLVVMGDNGFWWTRLINLKNPWYSMAINDLADSYGQEWTWKARHDLEYTCHSAYFVTIVINRVAVLLCCRTTHESCFRHFFSNQMINFAVFFLMFFSLFLTYYPPFQYSIQMFPLKLSWWLVGIPFSLAIIAFDECRKLFIRKYPNSQISQIIDY